MGTRREPRAAPFGPRDFLVRVASNWRTLPSNTASSPVNEPLLARTETGWALDTDDESRPSNSRRSAGPRTRRLQFGIDPDDLDEKDTAVNSLDRTRRWLVGCFVVILLAGTGWRVAASGQADLARAKSQWDAGVQKVQGWSATSSLLPQAGTSDESEAAPSGGGAELVEGEGAGGGADPLDSLGGNKASTGPASDGPPMRPLLESDDSSSAGKPGSSGSSLSAPAPLNVHPKPRPVDPATAAEQRYLAFDNHSGFHNRTIPLLATHIRRGRR